MAINWFPGHMHKARKDIARIMSEVDVVIEVLDARIPYSSENPLVPNLRGTTPCIKLLNKADLADPEITSVWVRHMEKEQGVKALPVSARQPAQIRQLLPMRSEERRVGKEWRSECRMDGSKTKIAGGGS